MKNFLMVGFFGWVVWICNACTGANQANGPTLSAIEENYGWKLGAQAYTFRNFTFSQTLSKLDSCGVKDVEAYPGQRIEGGKDEIMHFSMDQATRERVKKMLDDRGIELVAYGVVKANGLAEWKQVFEFCKYMGVETITCEPESGDLDIVSSLCDTYQINAAIHNHPAPTTYWNPDSVLAAINGRSERLGACADVGHWVRSGLDPLECMRKLNGHIRHIHMKDLVEANNKEATEAIWGRGVCNIPGVMAEMRKQDFKGMISVEYERNLSNKVETVKDCIGFFRNEINREHKESD